MKKIKILFLIPHLDLGGGVRRIKVYFDYIDKKKFTPVLCVYSKNVQRNIKEIIGKDYSFLVSDEQEKIENFINEEKIQILYTFYDGRYHDFLYRILKFSKQKKVKLIGNNVFAYFDEEMDSLFDLTVFQTKMMAIIKYKANLPKAKKFNFEKYRLLNNPVHTSYFEQLKIDKREKVNLRKKLGFEENDYVVGRFGRSDIVKWGDILIVALFKLVNYPEIKFLLVGVPKSRMFFLRFLMNFYPKLQKRILIMEPTSNDKLVMSYMQIVDVVGHGVNIGEGCSNAINEAMFWGKPVITNSTPHCDNGQVEQVEHLKTGIIANDGRSFAAAIFNLYRNPQLLNLMGKRAHAKAVNEYGAKKIVKDFEVLVNELISGQSNPKKISENQKEMTKYRSLYLKNLMSIYKVKETDVLHRLLRSFIRVINYGEFKFLNG